MENPNKKRMLIVLFMFGSYLIMLASFKKADSHSWYDTDCCNTFDCRPISDAQTGESEVVEVKGGYSWTSKESGKTHFFEHGSAKIRPSRDWNFHGCEEKYTKAPMCLYIPLSG